MPRTIEDADDARVASRSCSTELPEDLRRQAFTHASWVEHRAESYERLAFLGDVVLSLAVSTHLFPRFERYGAGRLTKVRAQAVSGASCARVARELGVPERCARPRPRARPDAAPRCWWRPSACSPRSARRSSAPPTSRSASSAPRPRWWSRSRSEIEEALEHPVDYKSVLQERLARRAEVVDYLTVAEEGPAHDRSFVAVAEVDGEELGRGEGKTKKGAEQEAALHALDRSRRWGRRLDAPELDHR